MILNGTVNTFRGFLVIAHVPGDEDVLLGQFLPQDLHQLTLNCDPMGVNNAAAIGHDNQDPRLDFQSVEMVWQAPSDANGVVHFR